MRKNEIQIVPPEAKSGEKEEHLLGMDLPESVQNAMKELSQDIQTGILEKLGNEESKESKKLTLEEIIASFDEETREKYVKAGIREFFQVGRVQERLYEAYKKGILKSEMIRMLDTLWNNRTANTKDDIELFNHSYYRDAFTEREKIESELNKKNTDKEALRKWIDKNSNKRRQVRVKKEELKGLIDDIDSIKKKLEQFDNEYGNSELDSMYFRDLASRQRKERGWLYAVALTLKYMDATDFSTVIGEELEFLFQKEKSIQNNGISERHVGFRGTTLEQRQGLINRADAIVDTYEKSVDEWYEKHETDKIMVETKNAKKGERQKKVIDHFVDLIAAYTRGKERGKSEEEMDDLVKLMEVSLTILGK